MARLPTVGGDDGSWGQILNEFLLQAHTSGGIIQDGAVGTSQLQSNSITAAKVQDGALTAAKLDGGTQSTLASVADKYEKPSDGIPGSDIAEATITPAKLASTITDARRLGVREIQAEAFASVMASLPTVSQTASQTVGSALLQANSSTYHYSNQQMVAVSGLGQVGTAYTAKNHGGDSAYTSGYQWSVEFDYYGQVLEPYLYAASNCKYWVWIDGQPTSAAPQTFPSPISGFRFLQHTFSTAAYRRIRIEAHGVNAAFNGVRSGNTVLAMPPSRPQPPVLGWLGDSYGDGRKATNELMGFVRTMGRLLGVEAWQGPSTGGQGLLYAPSGPQYTHRARISTDLAPINPDIVVVQGSINDVNTTWSGLVGPEMVACINEVKASLPNALIVATGPLFVASGATYSTMENELAAAVTAAFPTGTPDYVPYIRTVNDPKGAWFSGSGRVGNTTGDGLADVARDADNVHPTQLGHDIYARRFAGAIRSALHMT